MLRGTINKRNTSTNNTLNQSLYKQRRLIDEDDAPTTTTDDDDSESTTQKSGTDKDSTFEATGSAGGDVGGDDVADGVDEESKVGQVYEDDGIADEDEVKVAKGEAAGSAGDAMKESVEKVAVEESKTDQVYHDDEIVDDDKASDKEGTKVQSANVGAADAVDESSTVKEASKIDSEEAYHDDDIVDKEAAEASEETKQQFVKGEDNETTKADKQNDSDEVKTAPEAHKEDDSNTATDKEGTESQQHSGTNRNDPVQTLDSCKDDPSFLYKNLEGYDCAYIKSNKIEKCLKEHNGVLIGVGYCPESCGMVNDCLKAREKSVEEEEVGEVDVKGVDGDETEVELENEDGETEGEEKKVVDEDQVEMAAAGKALELEDDDDAVKVTVTKDGDTKENVKEEHVENENQNESAKKVEKDDDADLKAGGKEMDLHDEKQMDADMGYTIEIDEEGKSDAKTVAVDESDVKEEDISKGALLDNDDDESTQTVAEKGKNDESPSGLEKEGDTDNASSQTTELDDAESTSVLDMDNVADNEPPKEEADEDKLTATEKDGTLINANANSTQAAASNDSNGKDAPSLEMDRDEDDMPSKEDDDQLNGTDYNEDKSKPSAGDGSEKETLADVNSESTQDAVADEEKNDETAEVSSNEIVDVQNNETTPSNTICKDNPTFQYKDLEGYDCNYIKANKPEKCLKEYNGQPVAGWCPEACGVAKQCLEQVAAGLVEEKEEVAEKDMEAEVLGGEVEGGKLKEGTGGTIKTEVSGKEVVEDRNNATILPSKSGESKHSGNNETLVSSEVDAADEENRDAAPSKIASVAKTNQTVYEAESTEGGDSSNNETAVSIESEDSSNNETAVNIESEEDEVESNKATAIEKESHEGDVLSEETGSESNQTAVYNTTVDEPTHHSCKDDPTFLYKDLEGYDCDYIKANKPEKCLKEHNGQKVGLVSCPESCDMVDECQEAFGGAVTEDLTADSGGMDEPELTSIVEDSEVKSQSEHEGEAVVKTEEEIDSTASLSNSTDAEDSTLDVISTEDEEAPTASSTSSNTTHSFESSSVEESLNHSVDGEVVASEQGDEEALSNSADKEGSFTDKATDNSDANNEKPTSSSNCRDNPAFLYKDKEGYTCEFIGKYKLEKCEKEHNGVMIGISSCPESCSMVDKCLEAVPGETSLEDTLPEGSLSEASSANTPSAEHDPCEDTISFRLNGEPDKDCKWISQNERCELEHDETGKMIGRYFCPESCQLLDVKCVVSVDENVTLFTGGEAESLNSIGEDATKEENGSNIDIDVSQSSFGQDSQQEEYGSDTDTNSYQDPDSNIEEKLDGKWEVLEQEVQQEFGGDEVAKKEMEAEIENELENNSTSWAGAKMGDDTVDVGKYNDDVYGDYDDAYAGNNEYTYDNEASWNGGADGFGKENLDWNNNENVYSEQSGATWNGDSNSNDYNEPSSVSWNDGSQGYGQGYEQIEEQERWNDPTNGYQQQDYNRMPAETWDDEDDGFPVGMMLVFLIALAVLIYTRKNRQSSPSQSGYQRVEQPMYMNKRS